MPGGASLKVRPESFMESVCRVSSTWTWIWNILAGSMLKVWSLGWLRVSADGDDLVGVAG